LSTNFLNNLILYRLHGSAVLLAYKYYSKKTGDVKLFCKNIFLLRQNANDKTEKAKI